MKHWITRYIKPRCQTLLKYPASNALWGRFGSKKEKSKFISSSSSTKVFKITSISHVNISQAMKGNLNHWHILQKQIRNNIELLHLRTIETKDETKSWLEFLFSVLEGSFAFSIYWRLFNNISQQLLHLASIS